MSEHPPAAQTFGSFTFLLPKQGLPSQPKQAKCLRWVWPQQTWPCPSCGVPGRCFLVYPHDLDLLEVRRGGGEWAGGVGRAISPSFQLPSPCLTFAASLRRLVNRNSECRFIPPLLGVQGCSRGRGWHRSLSTTLREAAVMDWPAEPLHRLPAAIQLAVV